MSKKKARKVVIKIEVETTLSNATLKRIDELWTWTLREKEGEMLCCKLNDTGDPNDEFGGRILKVTVV